MLFAKKFNDAILFFKNKNYKNTITICEDILKTKESSEVFNLYGLALQKKGLFRESIEKFNQSIKINPANFEAYNNLAISLKNTFQFKLSEKVYMKCLKINPNYINAIINYALLKETINEPKSAIDLLLKVESNKLHLNKIFILNKLKELFLTIGDFNQAKVYVQKILKIDPKNIPALRTLSQLIVNGDDKNVINKMEDLVNSPSTDFRGLIALHFALGDVYDKKKNYKKAYFNYEKANKLKKSKTNSNIKELLKVKNEYMNFFRNFNFKNKIKNSKKKVLFIVGMPRSGTTLIEQIVSSHKEVVATGENSILQKVIVENFYKDKKFKQELVNQLLSTESFKIQNKYLHELEERNFISNTYTDKSIQNYLLVGFIKIFFPNAKIIITKRNIKDVCLSIYKHNFSSNYMNWKYDKDEIVNYYKIYSELILFWQNLFPNEIYFAEYEKIIERPDREIRKIIDFCDLNWDPNCLNPQNNLSTIKTASKLQARRSIYKSSKKNYENYLFNLNDMFKKLN